jgi:hypothetical protein
MDDDKDPYESDEPSAGATTAETTDETNVYTDDKDPYESDEPSAGATTAETTDETNVSTVFNVSTGLSLELMDRLVRTLRHTSLEGNEQCLQESLQEDSSAPPQWQRRILSRSGLLNCFRCSREVLWTEYLHRNGIRLILGRHV